MSSKAKEIIAACKSCSPEISYKILSDYLSDIKSLDINDVYNVTTNIDLLKLFKDCLNSSCVGE